MDATRLHVMAGLSDNAGVCYTELNFCWTTQKACAQHVGIKVPLPIWHAINLVKTVGSLFLQRLNFVAKPSCNKTIGTCATVVCVQGEGLKAWSTD